MMFDIDLHGSGDLDRVREAFEEVVRSLRDAEDPDNATPVSGTLILEGVPYDAADVPEDAPGDDTGDEVEENPDPDPEGAEA